ncbi:MAG: hypothetical protein ACI4KM_05990 [Oscillospiraceae bacterium]
MATKRAFSYVVISFLLFAGAVISLFATASSFNFVDADEAVPVITSLNVESGGSVRVEWDCYNADVTTYRVYRKENSSEPKVITVCQNFQRYYQDSDVKNGTVYTYYITAYNSKTDKKSEKSHAISICKDTTAQAVPLDQIKPELSVEIKSDKPVLKWQPAKNVPMTSVCIYKKSESDGWKVEKVLPPYITQYNAETGAEYKIVVRYSENEEVLVRSLESDIVKAVA